MAERNGEKKIIAFVKEKAKQFAAVKRHVVQGCFGKLNVAQITIRERTIDKAKRGKVCFRKIAVDEFADLVFGRGG